MMKYEKAKEYYAKEDYGRTVMLLDEVVPLLRGSEVEEEASLLLAKTYFNQKDYAIAAQYFTHFRRNNPASAKAEEAQFSIAECFYHLSPNARLDQSSTKSAIDAYQLYLNIYPNGEKTALAESRIKEMEDKLVYKSFLNAKLYFDLGSYLGNNYQSAVIAAQNSIAEYPETKYKEELSFLILKSKYIQAEKSVIEKMEERYRATIDEYYSFINEFPNSSYLKEAVKMFENSEKAINKG